MAEAQGAAAAGRSRPLGSALDPRASGSGAAHRRPGGGGKAARAPAPPPLASGGAAVAPPQAPLGKTRARQVPDELTGPVHPCPRHTPSTTLSRPEDGKGRAPRRARVPLGAPAPQTQPNGFRGACSGAGREWDGSVSPAFPEGSARALTSESRRSEAEEGGYPGASSSGS